MSRNVVYVEIIQFNKLSKGKVCLIVNISNLTILILNCLSPIKLT
jgi:hypothetical protein